MRSSPPVHKNKAPSPERKQHTLKVQQGKTLTEGSLSQEEGSDFGSGSLLAWQGGGSPSFIAGAFLQPKLRVGTPGDRFEREADAAAAQVVGAMGAPVASFSPQKGASEGPSEGFFAGSSR